MEHRQIIGSALGFKSNDTISYIIRSLIYRSGGRILSAIFASLFRSR